MRGAGFISLHHRLYMQTKACAPVYQLFTFLNARSANLVFSIGFALFFQSVAAEIAKENPSGRLFQHRFFGLSQDQSLLCATSAERYSSITELENIIAYYEQGGSKIRSLAVSVLTDHENEERQEDLQEFRNDCRLQPSPDFCVLEHYWDNREAALRALALFYDTKTIVKHSEDDSHRPFTVDHLRIFEKGIRKIPPFLRATISQAKPTKELESEILKLPEPIQALAAEAYPEDFATSIWTDQTHPLMFAPGVGFQSETVAQVFSGQNLILFTVKAFDKGKDGRMYRDINLKYLVDFRLPILIHEIAHTIDNFHFWDGEEDLYFFYGYRKLSNDEQTTRIINEAELALWPSKWFEAFEHLWEVNHGRYDGRIQEKLAELVAQYILIPERLVLTSPQAYQWLRDDVFRGIEYRGYDSCERPITGKLDFWQDSVAKLLGR